MTKLITARQAARMLGIGYQALWEWRKARKHLRYVKLGGRIHYYEDDVIAFITKNTFSPKE